MTILEYQPPPPQIREIDPVHLITVCSADRRKFLTTPDGLGILTAAWRISPRVSGWAVGRYVIMPDHLHFFVHPRRPTRPLGVFIEDWKIWTARLLTDVVGIDPPIWQPGFFEEALASSGDYQRKIDHVFSNPVRSGHVPFAAAWPYSGEIDQIHR